MDPFNEPDDSEWIRRRPRGRSLFSDSEGDSDRSRSRSPETPEAREQRRRVKAERRRRRHYIADLQERKDTVFRIVKQDVEYVANGTPGPNKTRAQEMLRNPEVFRSITTAVWKSLSGPGVPAARARDPSSIRAKLVQLYPELQAPLPQILPIPPPPQQVHIVDDDDEEEEEEEEEDERLQAAVPPPQHSVQETDEEAFLHSLSIAMADSLAEFEKKTLAPVPAISSSQAPQQAPQEQQGHSLCVFCIDATAATRACPACSTLLACTSCAKNPQVRSIKKCPLCRANLIPL